MKTSSFPLKRKTKNVKQIKRPVNNELHSIIKYTDTQQLYGTDFKKLTNAVDRTRVYFTHRLDMFLTRIRCYFGVFENISESTDF